MSFEHLALAGLFCWSNLRYLLVVMQLSAAKTLTAVFLHAWLSTLTISRTFIKLSFSHFPACDMVPHFSLEPETIAKLYRTFLCRIFIRFFSSTRRQTVKIFGEVFFPYFFETARNHCRSFNFSYSLEESFESSLVTSSVFAVGGDRVAAGSVARCSETNTRGSETIARVQCRSACLLYHWLLAQ